MKKARIALVAICLFAGIGGAVAFKARATRGFIKTGLGTNSYTSIPLTLAGCSITGPGCTTLTFGTTYQIYQFSTAYYPVQP